MTEMTELFAPNDATTKTKDDVTAIKEDIKQLMDKLKTLKADSAHALSDQLDHFVQLLGEMKVRGADSALAGLSTLCASTRKHPLRNLAYACGAGVVMAMLIRKG